MVETDARILKSETIRDAASVILLRDAATAPKVLMGQRGKAAVFMPSKFVFPGGALDESDGAVALARPLGAECEAALTRQSEIAPSALVAAGCRELWEETGLLLGRADTRSAADAPEGWQSYFETGHLPDGGALRFVFRAITPPGRSRRFDARFFLADVDALTSDPDDFSRAEDELSHLQWVGFDALRGFDMPFITEVVLAEIGAILQGTALPGVPFFNNLDEISRFERL